MAAILAWHWLDVVIGTFASVRLVFLGPIYPGLKILEGLIE
jgi:hypothetical protein